MSLHSPEISTYYARGVLRFKKKKSIFDDDNSHNLDIFLMYFMNHIALPIKTIQPFKYLNTDFLFLFFLNLTCLGYVPSYIFTLL